MTGLTGGCQCGAVRFRVTDGAAGRASICHCRMCQKAFGAFYAPLVTYAAEEVAWTRGEPARWRSSNHARRGFCPACGTPLTYEVDGDGVSLAIGAFDDPTLVPPTKQWGIERELPFTATLASLPGRTTADSAADAPYLADIVSYQHPDHDTDTWPEARS